MAAELLFLAVQYNNRDEIEAFAEHVSKLPNSDQIHLSVCDNSQVHSPPTNHVQAVSHRPDNPGYLDGALQALSTYLDQGNPIPSWVAITNTDITFEREDLIEVLRQRDKQGLAILAPRITEGAWQTEKNPHVISPRSTRRLRLNQALTKSPARAMGYLTVSALLIWLRRIKTSQEGTSAPALSTMYSPYGAQIYFSRSFIEKGVLPYGVPLLAEEWAIAEAAKDAGAKIHYTQDIWIAHDPHKTTGPKLTWKRARMLSRAFNYIGEATRDG